LGKEGIQPRDGRPGVGKNSDPEEERSDEKIGVIAGRLNERRGNGTKYSHPNSTGSRPDQ